MFFPANRVRGKRTRLLTAVAVNFSLREKAVPHFSLTMENDPETEMEKSLFLSFLDLMATEEPVRLLLLRDLEALKIEKSKKLYEIEDDEKGTLGKHIPYEVWKGLKNKKDLRSFHEAREIYKLKIDAIIELVRFNIPDQ